MSLAPLIAHGLADRAAVEIAGCYWFAGDARGNGVDSVLVVIC